MKNFYNIVTIVNPGRLHDRTIAHNVVGTCNRVY